MKNIVLNSLFITGLFLGVFTLGACSAPETTDANAEVKPEVKAEQKVENRKLERHERDFFDRGGMFK